MPQERRGHARLKGPFDGSWDGVSGMRTCRVTDLSASGCFIDAMASPDAGTVINVSIAFDGAVYLLPATVVYVDKIQGFAVHFNESEAASALARLIETRLEA